MCLLRSRFYVVVAGLSSSANANAVLMTLQMRLQRKRFVVVAAGLRPLGLICVIWGADGQP